MKLSQRVSLVNNTSSSGKMWITITLLSIGFLFADAVPQHDVYWRDYLDGHIPEDALFVENGRYIGQMPLNGILPGTIYADKKMVVTECCPGRKEATVGVRILCTRHPENFQWEYVNTVDVKTENSDDLVRGGIENNIVLYIGKIFRDREWKIGKVYPTTHKYRGLRIWDWEGDTHVAHDFQILKYVSRSDVRPNRNK